MERRIRQGPDRRRMPQAITSAPQLTAAAGQQLVQAEHLAKALLEQVSTSEVV